MSHFDLTTLRLFSAAVERQSIAHAARLNNIAASAVSKRITDLEARLGLSLLYRQKEGVRPTAAGEVLFRYAKNILRSLDDLEGELSNFTDGARGRVRLWANTSAITQFLPEDIAAFRDRFPDVVIELREDYSAAIVNAVLDGAADVGIFSEHAEAEGLLPLSSTSLIQSRTYRRDTLMVILPKGHPLAQYTTGVKLRDILNYDLVVLQEASSLQGKLTKEAKMIGAATRISVSVLSFDGIRRMVEAGLGLAVLPQGAVLPYISDTSIAAIPLTEPWALRNLILCFREYRLLPVAARSLVDALAPLPITASPSPAGSKV